jgi:hypothetical protein
MDRVTWHGLEAGGTVQANRYFDRRGIALSVTLMVVVLIGAIVAAALTAAMSTTRTVNADYFGSRAFYAAEAGAEHALAQVELALQDGFLSEAELAAVVAPKLEGFDFFEFSVTKDGVGDTTRITDGPFAGLYAIIQDIRVTSRVTDGSGAHSAVVVGAQAQAIPMFQFAAFGHGAMEAYTGSRSDTWGRAHVNGDIYMATSDHHIHTILTTPGRFIRDGRVTHKDLDDIEVYVELSNNSEVLVTFDSETTPDPDEFKNRSDGELEGRIRTAAMGVDSLNLPLPPGMDPYELVRPREASDGDVERATKFAWKADLYVTIDLTDIRDRSAVCGTNSVPVATKVPSITLERFDGGALPADDDKCRIFPFDWEAFYDWKELKWVDAATVDVDELRSWVGASVDAPEIIYVEVIPSSSVQYSGTTSESNDNYYWPVLRVKNGSRLPGPLTVGSMLPLYMQGNYNTVDKQPAAVFGDRLTGLSECWTDDNSPNKGPTGGNNPNACHTYQYFSIVTGESEGYMGCYHHGPDPGCTPIPSGQSPGITIQNLEDWRACGGRCDYYVIGSFITFWSPKIASPWRDYPNPGPVYRSPHRNWSFDDDLANPENLPPGTPNVGYVLRASFKESY